MAAAAARAQLLMPANIPPPAVAVDPPQIVADVVEQNAAQIPAPDPEANDQRQCVVCLLQPATRVFVPCGHFCICAGCAPRIDERCPICRQQYQNIVVVY